MDISSIGQIISTVGFPIAMCILMAWYEKYTTDLHREDTNTREEAHKQEVNDITKALNNNTLVLQKLVDILDASEVDLTK